MKWVGPSWNYPERGQAEAMANRSGSVNWSSQLISLTHFILMLSWRSGEAPGNLPQDATLTFSATYGSPSSFVSEMPSSFNRNPPCHIVDNESQHNNQVMPRYFPDSHRWLFLEHDMADKQSLYCLFTGLVELGSTFYLLGLILRLVSTYFTLYYTIMNLKCE